MFNFKLTIFASVFWAFLISAFIFSPPVFSQGTASLESKLVEYNLKNEEYKKAHSEYLLKRSQYLKFQTLTSKADAYEATLAMLKLRDGVVVSHLLVIGEKLVDVLEISDERRAALNLTIFAEIAWFENHRDGLTSAGTLDNLVKDSNLAKERYKIVGPLAYEVFATISFSKLDDFYRRLKEISTAINEKVGEIKKEEREEYQFSVRKQGILDRWIFESDGRIARGEEKKTEAGNSIFTPAVAGIQKYTMSLTEYNEAIVVLGESRLFLNEASSLLKEIVREVKIAE